MNRTHFALAASFFFASFAALAQHGEAVEAASSARGGEHAAAVGGHHAAPHVSNWWGMGEQYSATPALGWLTVTFLVFVGVFVFFAGPALKRYLEARADVVETAMAEARRAKENAEGRAREAEAKLAALSGEVDKMKAEFAAQGRLESQRIAAVAAEMAKKIGRDAEDTIGAETQRAMEALRVEASRLALQIAEDRIKQMLSAADDERFKGSLLQGLSA